MSLLARFEEVAELLFTGAFRKNAARLQPVEIAKELVKAMLKHKHISISQVYVPNVYRVFLHSNDWGPLASFGDAFLIELSKYVFAQGERYGFTFLTKPAIELHADDHVEQHKMFIEVDFDDSVVVDWGEDEDVPEDDGKWHEATNIFRDGVKTNLAPAEATSRNPEYFLEVIEGPDAGQTFPLAAGEIHLGRHSQCEVVLTDPEVSRRHLKITVTEQGWLIDDLGSTNGTWVNGQRVVRQNLAPGDRIALGQTKVVLKRDTAYAK